MSSIYDVTEQDEQSDNLAQALHQVRIKVAEYLRGNETLAVVSAYELSAMKLGATHAQLEAVWFLADNRVHLAERDLV